MAKIEINARGLSSTEIQSVIDSTVDFRNRSLAESKEQVKGLLVEYLMHDLEGKFALAALEAIQKRHPKLLQDKIINKEAAYSLDDFEIVEAE